MNTPKTLTEKQDEKTKLTTLKPKVIRRSIFGDDHHAAIDAQIEVLTENLTLEQIEDRRANEDNEDEDDKWTDHVTDSAREARQWADGDLEQAPSESWRELVR